jgi:hypothetical protein
VYAKIRRQELYFLATVIGNLRIPDGPTIMAQLRPEVEFDVVRANYTYRRSAYNLGDGDVDDDDDDDEEVEGAEDDGDDDYDDDDDDEE